MAEIIFLPVVVPPVNAICHKLKLGFSTLRHSEIPEVQRSLWKFHDAHKWPVPLCYRSQ